MSSSPLYVLKIDRAFRNCTNVHVRSMFDTLSLQIGVEILTSDIIWNWPWNESKLVHFWAKTSVCDQNWTNLEKWKVRCQSWRAEGNHAAPVRAVSQYQTDKITFLNWKKLRIFVKLDQFWSKFREIDTKNAQFSFKRFLLEILWCHYDVIWI